MVSIEKNQAIDAENKHKQLDRALMRQQGRRGALIEVLHEAQRIFGYLPRDIMGYIAASLHLPPSHVFGVASFYPSFRLHPPAEHTVRVCMGTACYVNGASRVLRSAEKQCARQFDDTADDAISFGVQAVHCLGTCGSGPVMQVDDELYLHATSEMIASALDHHHNISKSVPHQIPPDQASRETGSAAPAPAGNGDGDRGDGSWNASEERQQDDA